ncbi:DegT/DnrJ/EryC1/StrS family aminotransferase [Helicobacter sp. MIT 21-1697]|uniref:DegT/DnrJ/EryC1/StrS family aminotransferase n=1 Tax=Helicobacter sp. MIT 21-1697 TaxID=2993733 RepID=UPI00224A9C38|nr:DegT/DnrJ/EryC1/StrS family aminotransferase [Helicobacter sp. MIT 21-1697]MCX2716237.1 DegT/DnrJ/EryC1/StrS family aminotransferase [Helicobacter sp. MIT 21-1697]
MEFINLKAQYEQQKSEIDNAIQDVLHSSQFIMGKAVEELESHLSSYVGAKNAIACSSGTDALILALMALDIKNGDEVITSPFSFIASVEAIMLLGAKPIFVDIDEKTYNLDSTKLENAITKHTKAIIPVAIFGQMADMQAINAIALKHNIPVIEDAAQSFGATQRYNDKILKSCNASMFATTSFFPSKPLGCYGDGGAVFTNDEKFAQKIRYLLNHGQTKRYEHSFIGLNARLDALQAAILNVKIKYLDSEIAKRQEIARIYDENLRNVIIPFIQKGNVSAYAQYSIRTKNRAQLIEKLTKAHIPYAVHYPIALHLQEVVRKVYGYKKGDFPISEVVCDEILSLPFSPFLSAKEQDQVIKAVNG